MSHIDTSSYELFCKKCKRITKTVIYSEYSQKKNENEKVTIKCMCSKCDKRKIVITTNSADNGLGHILAILDDLEYCHLNNQKFDNYVPFDAIFKICEY